MPALKRRSENIYFYSDHEPLVIRSKKYELYIQGNPVLYSSVEGTKTWIENISKGIRENIHDIEKYIYKSLKKTSGLYSLILILNDKIILASDVIRSFPLIYGFRNGDLFITDNIEEYQKEHGRLEIADDRIEEFLAYGNIFENNTLYKDIFGLQAGEIVSISENKIESNRYFIFKPADKPDIYKSVFDFSKAFDELFVFVFSRMINDHPEVNNWIVPLSGGHDSRLVVNYLYRLGVKNVICFSYGTKGNKQSVISKQVAEALGYKWYFIEYNDKKWNDIFRNGVFGEFVDYAFNGISTPHIQDFLAVYEMKRMGIIKEGDVFLPGHTVVTETVFSEATLKLKTREEAINYVYSTIIMMKPEQDKNKSLLMLLEKMYDGSGSKPENFMSYCDWQERQSKYITNSVRGYEFMGFRCFQPMWDAEMVDFWLKIPADWRVERDPLYQMEKNYGLVEQLMQIPYTIEDKKSLKSKMISIIRRSLPEIVIIYLLKVLKRKVKLNEGLNETYALAGLSVPSIIEPVEDFHKKTHGLFYHYLKRMPYQIDPVIMTSLYTIRRLLNRKNK